MLSRTLFVALSLAPAMALAADRPSVCVRAFEHTGIAGDVVSRMREAVRSGLRRYGVRVASAGETAWCHVPAEDAEARVVYVDVELIRIGQLAQVTIRAFPGRAKRARYKRTWSEPLDELSGSSRLARDLEKVGRMARSLLPARPKPGESRVTPEPIPEPPEPDPPEPDPPELDPEPSEPGSESEPAVAVAKPISEQEPTSLLTTTGMVLTGVGVAGLVTAAAFGIKTLVHKSRAEDGEPGSQLEIPRAETSRDAANISLAAGGAVAVIGAVLWWLGDDDVNVAVAPAPGRAWVLTGVARF